MEARFIRGDTSVKPTASTYTTVIKAWMRSGESGSTRRIEDIVSSLEQQQRPTMSDSSSSDLSSNGDNNNDINDTQIQRDPSGVLIQPDTSIYNALLNCWAKDGRPATRKAESVLERMEQAYRIDGNDSLRPNVVTYTTVIDILSKSPNPNLAAERALQMLDSMEDAYLTTTNDDTTDTTTPTNPTTSPPTPNRSHHAIRPNVYTYTAVISCYARSRLEDKAVHALALVRRMEERFRGGNEGARPNAVAYNNVLNACAYTTGGPKAIETAFRIACVAFDEIRSSDYLDPTHVTYGTYLSVCGNLMPESGERDALVEAVFKRCRREGLCSEMVLDNLWAAASERLRVELLDGVEDGSKIPKRWYRNI